jgi:hypothetical protein
MRVVSLSEQKKCVQIVVAFWRFQPRWVQAAFCPVALYQIVVPQYHAK